MSESGFQTSMSNFDVEVACMLLDEFINAPKVNGLPKWKKNQLNKQAQEAKRKLENSETDFYAVDMQALLAAALLMDSIISEMPQEENDKYSKRVAFSVQRILNSCEEYFESIGYL